MIEPSKEWTQEERLKVIEAIVDEIASSYLPAFHPLRHHLDRIRFVALMPAEFLEANRKQILEG